MTIYWYFIFNIIAIKRSDGLTRKEARVKKNGKALFGIPKQKTF